MAWVVVVDSEFGGQMMQAVAPGNGLKNLAAQGKGMVAAVVAVYVPGEHCTHAEEPGDETYFPAWHALHTLEPLVAVVVPGAHGTHVGPDANVPTEQLVHDEAAGPETAPMRQGRQVEAPARLKDPAEQNKHAPVATTLN